MQFHPGFTYECFYYQQSEEGNKAFPHSTRMTLQQPAATLTGVGTAFCHLYHTENAPGAMAAGCLWHTASIPGLQARPSWVPTLKLQSTS